MNESKISWLLIWNKSILQNKKERKKGERKCPADNEVNCFESEKCPMRTIGGATTNFHYPLHCQCPSSA